MPTAGGPNTLGESNLVFAYDTGDVSNSYIGEPTVNYQWNGGSEVTPWTVSGTNTDVSNTSERGPVKGAKTWKFEKTGGSNQWNGWESNYGGIWTGNSGDVWTTSYWYKTAAPAGNTGFGVGYFYTPDWSRPYSTTILANVSDIIADGQWHHNYTVTQFNENYSNAIVVDGPSWGYSTSAGVLYINGLQWEKKSHPTPFGYGTRSATQGLLPLIGNSTIDLTNVSFDSNAQMVFDGTNDYIATSTAIPCNFGTGDFTVEVLIYPESFASYAHMVALPNQSTFALKANISDGVIYYYDPAFSTYGSTSGWTLTLNQWNHVVLVRSGNVAYAYLNGVPKGSKTGFNTNFSSTQIVNVGNGGTSEYTQKKIDVVKIYNRALTAQEVRQNYQQYKTRFNLS